MRKKQKISEPTIKIEQQSEEPMFEMNRYDRKNEEKDESADEVLKKSQNTLSILTKNFISLIKSKQNMTIDSNDAAKQLGIQKRRIYDITNVLQGIGYVEKVHKNKLRWVGGVKDPKVSCQIGNLDSEITSLERKQQELTSKIDYLEKRIKNDFSQNKELNFLRLSYLRQIMQNLVSRPARIIVVKAPKDTAIMSHKRQDTNEVEIEIVFSKQSKGSVFYLNKVTSNQVKQEKKVKYEKHQKKVKREEF